jgi:hypothetical protein
VTVRLVLIVWMQMLRFHGRRLTRGETWRRHALGEKVLLVVVIRERRSLAVI